MKFKNKIIILSFQHSVKLSVKNVEKNHLIFARNTKYTF